MFALIARFASYLSNAMSSHDAAATEVAHSLMEAADARAGTDPFQAAELRGAALQFISVVR